MSTLNKVFTILVFLFGLWGCKQLPTESSSTNSSSSAPLVNSLHLATATTTTTETFEAGTKTAYAAADVAFTTGTWNLSDALVGTSSSDAKDGSKSVRVRLSGLVTMKFDLSTGASTVVISHAKYGSDGSSTWGLWYSTNSGSSWTQAGSTVTTSSTTLTTATFTVNVSGTIRFQIQKTDGSSTRINIDDVIITSYSGSSTSSSEHLVLGNPSGAVKDTTVPANYLMEKTQYVVCYNRDKGTPNWVAWHLSTSWIGSATRQDDYRADTSLPASWYHVQGTSYSGSGYDRGHMCPSADRTSSTTDNSATFLMTNFVPQASNNNQGPWEKLEDSCRVLVNSKGKELYIYSGGVGSLGTINSGHVTVPAYTWKVIVVLDSGDNDLSRVTTSTRVIAILIPNSDSSVSTSDSWKSYRVSVDSIETLTGYDFLSNVSTSIQTTLESKVDSL
jgi:endonuclease G, mitochondrial